MTASSGHFSIWGLWLRIAILVTIYRGIPALAQLKEGAAPSAAPIAPTPAAPQTTPEMALKISYVPQPKPEPEQRVESVPMWNPEVPALPGYDISRR